MKRLQEVLLVLLTMEAVIVGSQGNASKEKPDHRGKTFLLGFLEMDRVSATSSVFITSATRGHVNISSSESNFTATVLPGTSKRINFPSAVRMAGFGKEKKGILITSDVPISVYATNARPQSRDVHAVFPSSTLGTEHMAVTFTPQSKSLIGIIASHDNTLVQVRLRFQPPAGNASYLGKTYRNGDVLRVFLNRLETFQVQCRHDLTGTAVISSKPVAVLSGNACASVPSSSDTCSHLAVQVTSVSKWGTRFIATPVPDRKKHDLFRIVAAYSETLISIKGKRNFTLNAGEFRQFQLLSTEYRYITSSRPSMLVQFNKGSLGYVNSEPFTLLVPPVEQYGYGYDLAVPVRPPADFLNFISIVAETAQTHRLLFNTSLLEPIRSIRKFNWHRVPGTQYSATSSMLLYSMKYSTSISLSFNSSDIRFAVYVVGHTDKDGYGYLAGMTMADINCKRLFAAGVQPLGKDCEETTDSNVEYVERTCNLNAVSAGAGSAYLKDARFNDSITTPGDCEKLVNRTWYARAPNGSAVCTFATQRIRWRKPEVNVTFPADAHVDLHNFSTLDQLKPNLSSLCPLDGINVTYVDRVYRDDNITLVRRLWIVREDCGRTVTGNQTIIVYSPTSPTRVSQGRTTSISLFSPTSPTRVSQGRTPSISLFSSTTSTQVSHVPTTSISLFSSTTSTQVSHVPTTSISLSTPTWVSQVATTSISLFSSTTSTQVSHVPTTSISPDTSPAVNSSTNSTKNKNLGGRKQTRQVPLDLVLGLSIGLGAVVFLVTVIAVFRICKIKVSRSFPITTRIDVLEAQDKPWHYTNTVVIELEHSAYKEINIETLTEKQL